MNLIENFEFLLGIVIWYKLLLAMNTMSKLLQAKNMDINVAIKQLKDLFCFLKTIDKAIVKVKQMTSEIEIEAIFWKKRIIRRKK
jgi:hypothetical protein